MKRNLHRSALLVTMVGFLSAAGMARGFTLEAHQDLLISATMTGTGSESLAPVSGDGSRANPYVYDWAASGVSDHLDLGAWMIRGGGPATTPDVSFVLNLNGGNVTGSATYAFQTYRDMWDRNLDVGSVTLTNANDISIGAILTTAQESRGGLYAKGGPVTFGQPSSPAGHVRVDRIDTRTFEGTPGSIGGAVKIYAVGNVTIATDAGAPGAIMTGGGRAGGNIEIRHAGNLVAGTLDTSANASFDTAGHVMLDGKGAGGTCDIGVVDTRQKKSGIFGWDAGNVTITSYGSVAIRSALRASTLGTYNWDNPNPDGGDINITNISGIIQLDCEISCNGSAEDIVRDGAMHLANTAGPIVIGSASNAGTRVFDVYNFRYTLFDADDGVSWIYDDINHFVEGESRLRVRHDGDIIYYAIEGGEVNGDLLAGGVAGVYEVYSAEGGVGYLKPILPGALLLMIR